MMGKRKEKKGFCKNIRWHILSWYPRSQKSACLNMTANEMMAYINVF